MMNKRGYTQLTVTLLLGAALTCGIIRAAAQYNDGIAAVVAGEVVTVYEVVRETNAFERRLAKRYQGNELAEKVAELRKLAAERLVEQELIYAEYRARQERQPGFGLPEEFVQRNLDRIVVQEANGDWAEFRNKLEEGGTSLAEFRADLSKRLAVDVMIDELVRRPVRVSADEIDFYYAQHRDEFTEPDRIKLAVIFLQAGNGGTDGMANTAVLVKQRLDAGEDFAVVARDVSYDAASAAKGGELDWIETRSGRELFVTAAEPLPKGGIAGPLEAEEGVYFVKLLDTEAARTLPLTDELRAAVSDKLLAEKQQYRYEQLIDKLKQKFYVKTYY